MTRLLRVTALVIKFVKAFKIQRRNTKHEKKGPARFTAPDLKEAELLWIKTVQASAFPKEIEFLTCKGSKSAPPTYVAQFGLLLDGVLKCKGRLNNSALPPILMPAKHDFVRLLIGGVHNAVKHSGIKGTLTTLRERFWVLRGREAVKRILRNCVVCRKFDGVPYQPQSPADLPSTRVSDDPPFTHVGVDFAGRLYVQDKHLPESTEPYKVYIYLLTCASTKAVHLEVTRGLDVQAFLLAFRRFAARRGLPDSLNSDNAKTFKASCNEIRKITRSNEVCIYLVNNQIWWNFIIERAPWWRGYWERPVRSIKKQLKKLMGRCTRVLTSLIL